jgi:hypothetical protein
MDAITSDALDAAWEEAEPETAAPTTKDIEIDPPINFLKRDFTRLHLVEPNGLQCQKAEQELGATPTPYTLRRYQITLVAGVAKVPREVVEQMRISQIEEAADFLRDLQERGRSTGAT